MLRQASDGSFMPRQRRRVPLDRLQRHPRPAERRHTLIRAGRPQTNGAVEAFHRLVLEECWRPAFARYLHVRFTGLKRDLERYIDAYNLDQPHHGRLTQGRIPADIVYGANKMKTR
jgi:transposase InsO family protein